MSPLVPPAGGYREIAVLRLSSLGDVVLTLPLVHALAERWPHATIRCWVFEEYADILRGDPALHVRALERDARRIEDLVSMSAELESCDLIVDLHANARTRVLTFRQRAPVLRVRGRRLQRERWVHARWTHPAPLPHVTARYAATVAPIGVTPSGPPVLRLADRAVAWARAVVADLARGGRCVALCPGAKHATKRWPEPQWCELERALATAGVARIVLSTPAERAALPALAARIGGADGAAWHTESLDRAAALLGACDVAVTSDSGLMHVAAATGRRVVAIFGSTSPALGFAPAGEGHAVLCRELSCQPCTLHGRERCPRGHFRCMLEITPADVLARVLERLA